MNVTEAAVVLGVSAATVSRICSGDRRPSLDLMLKIRDEWNWKLEDQGNLLAESTSAYADRFRRRMESRPAVVVNGSS